MSTKLDRATAALVSGKRYTMQGEVYEFWTLADRAVCDLEPPEAYAGALWLLVPADDPLFLVSWNGGRVDAIDGVSTRYRSLDVVHETKHAERDYRTPWYACDMQACGLVDL